jgi:hypothetical protein
MGRAAKPPAEAEAEALPVQTFWRYVGEVERILQDLALHVRQDDVIETDTPPGDPGWWEPTDGPATVAPGRGSGYRVWTPEELAAGTLIDDEPGEPTDA